MHILNYRFMPHIIHPLKTSVIFTQTKNHAVSHTIIDATANEREKVMSLQLNEQKRRVASTYNLAAGGYDKEPLRFFPLCAQRLVELVDLRAGQHVLDVATGTGVAAMAAPDMWVQKAGWWAWILLQICWNRDAGRSPSGSWAILSCKREMASI